MSLSIWNVFEYIFKWKWLIAIVIAISILLANFYVSSNQTYSAEVVIRYVDANAVHGLTPQNTPLDVYDIMSPSILTDAINDLNLKIGVEDIKKNLVIEPIIPAEQEEIKENKIKANEEYYYFPINYAVRYTVDSSKNGGYARDVLDRIMYYYHKFYSENYLNHTNIHQLDYKSKISFYDYLEIADFMNKDTSDVLTYIDGMAKSYPDFRSPNTGLSFNDLRNEYNLIKEFELTGLFTDIFSWQVTQDKEVLLKVYKYKKEQSLLENKNKEEETAAKLGLMEQFVESNNKVMNSKRRAYDGNDNFETKEIIIHGKPNRAKSTYDDLVEKYVSSGVAAGSHDFDAQYYQDVINIFSSNDTVSTQEQTESVINKISSISKKLDELHETLNIVINDFNRYSAGKHIVNLSSISIFENLSVRLYTFIALVVGLMLGVALSILIEVIRYYTKDSETYKSYNGKNVGISL